MLDKILNSIIKDEGKPSSEVAKWLFDQLNIRAKREDDNKSSFHSYSFDYQDCFFHLETSPDQPVACLKFFYILTESYDYQAVIYFLCNYMNQHSGYYNTFYHTYDETDNTVSVHLTSSLILDGENEKIRDRFTDALAELFELRRVAYNEFEEVKASYDKQGRRDVFDDAVKQRRSLYLLMEHELDGGRLEKIDQTTFRHFRMTPQDLFSLPSFPIDESKIVSVSLTRVHQAITYISQDEYGTFDIAAVIREQRGEEEKAGKTVGSDYLLAVTLEGGMTYKVDFQWQSTSKVSNYYWLEIIAPWEISKKGMVQEAEGCVGSVYVLDKSADNNHAEVRFMMDDAKDKYKNNKLDELTEEQKNLVVFMDWDLSDDVYWGTKYFNDKAFFQCIKHLERVVLAVRPVFNTFTRRQKNVAMDVYYKLGYAYAELKIYSKALSVLQIPYNFGSIIGSVEYINCLMNTDDFRAESVVDQELGAVVERLSNIEEDEEDAPEGFVEYKSFLCRQKVYILENARDFAQAESFLKGLLKEENVDLRSFAEEEMKHLKEMQMAEQRKESESTDKKS